MSTSVPNQSSGRTTVIADFASISLPRGWQVRTCQQDGKQVQVLHAEDGADELSIPLGSLRQKQLHVGLVAWEGQYNSALEYCLTPGNNWQRVRPMRFVEYVGTHVQDACLGSFDIEDAVLKLRTTPDCVAALSYIQTSQAPPLQPVTRTRQAGVVFDSNMTMSTYRIDEPNDLLTILRPYVGSGFSHIFWGTTVGTYSPLYRSKRLGWHGKEKADFGVGHRNRTAAVMRMFDEQGVDPFEYVIDFAHEHGMQIWADYRINKNHALDFAEDYAGGRFMCEHRDKLVQERDGSPSGQMILSFAYPEVREMAVAMLIEQASYDVDGLFIDFCRQYPLVGWEPIVVDAFKSKTGIDPHHEPVSNWRVQWYEHLCSYVTQFIRDLRETLNPIEQQRGSRMPIAVQVPGAWRFGNAIPTAMADAMDPFSWAREGLVDIIAPAEWTAIMYEPQCLDRFALALRDTDCKLWGAIGPQFREGAGSEQQRGDRSFMFADADPWRLMFAAHDAYQQGTEGVFIWEAHEMANAPQRWDIIKHISDHEFLKQTFGDKLGKYDGSHWVQQRPL